MTLVERQSDLLEVIHGLRSGPGFFDSGQHHSYHGQNGKAAPYNKDHRDDLLAIHSHGTGLSRKSKNEAWLPSLYESA